jgi:hypothetical protein
VKSEARALRLGYSGAEEGSERQRDRLDLRTEVHDRKNPDQNCNCRSYAWDGSVTTTHLCSLNAAQCQQNDAH